MTEDHSDILARALADFAECEERERENRAAAEDDIRFARLEEQWPEGVRRQRLAESRPCLVVNKLPTFIRQVVNDSRPGSLISDREPTMVEKTTRRATPGTGWTPAQRKAAERFNGRKGAPGDAANPYVPQTRAQYEGLRRGAYYIASDGTFSRKGGRLAGAAKPPSALATLAARAGQAAQRARALQRQIEEGASRWAASAKADLDSYKEAVAEGGHPEAAMWLPPVETTPPSPPPPRYEDRVDDGSVIKLAREARLASPRWNEDWERGRGLLEGYYVPQSVARIADDPRKAAILREAMEQDLVRRAAVIAGADRDWDNEDFVKRNGAARMRAAWNGALFESFPYAEAAAESLLRGTPFVDNLGYQKRLVERDDDSDIPGRGFFRFVGSLLEPSPFGKARRFKRTLDTGWDGVSGFAGGYLDSDAHGVGRVADGVRGAAANIAFGRVADGVVTSGRRVINDAMGYDPASGALQSRAARQDNTTLNGLALGPTIEPLGPGLPHLAGLADAVAARRRADPPPWTRYAEMFREPVQDLSPHSLDELHDGLTDARALDQVIQGQYIDELLDLDGDRGDLARDLLAEGSKARIEADRAQAARQRQKRPVR